MLSASLVPFGTHKTALSYALVNCRKYQRETWSLRFISKLVSSDNVNQQINHQTPLMLCLEAEWTECAEVILKNPSVQLRTNKAVADCFVSLNSIGHIAV